MQRLGATNHDGERLMLLLAPRLPQVEAILEAARFDRAFLRLEREFRNQRRMFASLVVAGGQVNITKGPQQVNVTSNQ